MWANPLDRLNHLQVRSKFGFLVGKTVSCNREDAVLCVKCLSLCHGPGKAKHLSHHNDLS